ncbi:MAG: alpha-E domain-containing protein [Alphaproteobacteria bacterium]|nr:alpha-E domain-containing protein [Alphaproteobacteria bacterium]MBU0792700.1 alpha-E domain-containing protein [Alphaproteobacteria bacterium]MBU0877295.1 alpha-E domain-containing protein [Alphaproteobacteria bacterium]MBU1770530.1 alpha-E domain-containing protein [Alphaproteobacteria bacterium]
MLSRTAENLFWMARYMERAEATARLLTMGQRMTILPGATMRDEWRSVVQVTECEDVFGKDAIIREADIVEHLILNADNPASIRACLARARQNGKSVRTALTQEMWEALNEGWRKLETYGVNDARREFAEIIDWVKTRAMIFRGATESGQLRNEGHDFLRVGGALERAQMTLRLLDVKYYVLLPETEVVGGHRDHYQWTSVLHALSGSRAYHHVYGGSYTPAQITDFLMLNRQFPRSTLYCFDQMAYRLQRLASWHGQRTPANLRSEEMVETLAQANSGDIFRRGLHETVQNKIVQCNALGHEIAQAYHFG